MTSIIARYVSQRVSAGILLVIMIILGLDVFLAILAELDKVINNYDKFDAILYIASTVPRRINDYLPYSVMIGCLFGLGGMAQSSELTVIRAAGVSVLRIILMALRPVMIFVLLGVVLSEYLAPLSEHVGESRRNVLRYGSHTIEYGGGVWLREGSQYMRFSAVESGGVLHGINIYGFDQDRLIEVTSADKAIYQENKQWQLETVSHLQLDTTETRLKQRATEVWQTQINPSLLNVIALKPKRQSLTTLYRYASFTGDQGLDNGRFVLSFWQKLLQPVAMLALVIASMSFIFGPMRQTTMGFRLFCGVATGVAFRMLQNIFGPASLIYGFSPAIGVIAPIVLCLIFAWYMLRRV